MLGIADREGRLAFGLTLWNGQDPILKERFFGLTGLEGILRTRANFCLPTAFEGFPKYTSSTPIPFTWQELARRLSSLFLPDSSGHRPTHGGEERYANDPHWKDLVLFYEYFHADTGRGVGASHQTGWTALVAPLLEGLARRPI